MIKSLTKGGKKGYKLRYISTLALIISLNYCLVLSSVLMEWVTIILLAVLILTGDVMDDFYTYIAIIPATRVSINGKDILFVFLIISMIKLILSNRSKVMEYMSVPLVSGVLLVVIELLNDFLVTKIGNFLYVFCFLAYFVIFILYADLIKYNRNRALLTIISTFIVSIIYTLISSGGSLAYYLYETKEYIRFGETARDIGGAMGIPIYCLLGISLLIEHFTEYKTKTILKNLIFFLVFFFLIIGLLTISRTFILGLTVLVICAFLSAFKKKNRKLYTIFLIVFVGIYLYIYSNPEIVNNLINKFTLRFSTDFGSDKRMDIYKSCFNYLLNNPLALLFGKGNINYVQIGGNEGYLFYAMAHNIYLDGIMSWGIVGFTSLICLVLSFVKRCKIIFNTKASLLSVTPVLIIAVVYMTEGSFYYFQVYMYILYLLLNMLSYRQAYKEV